MPILRALLQDRMLRTVHDFIIALASPFRGVYPSMEAARAAAPRARTFGYDNQQAAEMYRECLQPRWGDYALIYWLGRVIGPGSKLLDIGGNIGLIFYAFEKYVSYPPDFKWVVYDLPASIEAGKKFMAERPRPNLAFTARLEDCPHPDIILASGAMQYIDWELADFLATLSPRPKNILINKLPAYQGPSFVTLQDIGPSIVAYRVFNGPAFIQSMVALGYELIDRWDITELHCNIPLHPSRTVSGYSGMYFQLGA
jgi:putative methyltransferase (TIGR04325 family)